MSLFYVWSDGDRSVIHTEAITEKRVVEGVLIEVPFEPRSVGFEADSWIAAKKAFGFDLTPMQTAMLGAA